MRSGVEKEAAPVFREDRSAWQVSRGSFCPLPQGVDGRRGSGTAVRTITDLFIDNVRPRTR